MTTLDDLWAQPCISICPYGNLIGLPIIYAWGLLGLYSVSVCVSSKLVINQIIPEDDAIYQCQAENEQGSVLSVARLIVVMSEDRPSAPRNIRADTVSSSAILLAWERPLYNSDKVIAYSVHYMKAEGECDANTCILGFFWWQRNSCNCRGTVNTLIWCLKFYFL